MSCATARVAPTHLFDVREHEVQAELAVGGGAPQQRLHARAHQHRLHLLQYVAVAAAALGFDLLLVCFDMCIFILHARAHQRRLHLLQHVAVARCSIGSWNFCEFVEF